MKLTKPLPLLGTVLVLALGAAACGDDDGAAPATVAPTAAVTTTVPTTVAPTTAAPTTAAPTTAAPTTAPGTTAAATTAPKPTDPPPSEAVQLLAAANLVEADAPEGWIVTKRAHELTSSLYDLAQFTGDLDECTGLEAAVPVPYDAMSSAARIDLGSRSGASGSIYLVLMPDEAAAVDFMNQVRDSPEFADCLLAVVVDFSVSQLPPGFELGAENLRPVDPLDAFGDDQTGIAHDMSVIQDGAVLLEATWAERYTRIGDAILVVNGNVALDSMAAIAYERLAAS